MRRAIVTWLAGFAAIAALCGVALAQAPPRLVAIGVPGVKAIGPTGASSLAPVEQDATICQPGEGLPAGVSAIRISIWAFYGARVRVSAYRETLSGDSSLLTEGSHSADWTGDSVTVPVRPLRRAVPRAKLCLSIGPNSEPLQLLGPRTQPGEAAVITTRLASPATLSPRNASLLPGRMVVEYLRPGSGSWLTRLLAVARRFGLGRLYSGTWIALLAAALMAGAGLLAVRLTLRELR